MKYSQIVAVGLSLVLFFTSLGWDAVDAQDLEDLPLTLEEYHDAWISYLEDRLAYARQQGDERLENAMLWILEQATKESIAERLEEGEGGLAIRSVAENVIFEWEYEGGGTVRFWVGDTEGKKIIKMGLQPRQKSDCEWSLSWSTENWSVSATTAAYGIDFQGSNLTGWETGFHAPDGLDSPANVRQWRFGSGWATGEGPPPS